MAEFKNYDPFQITASFKGLYISGFAEGTFVKAERNVDTYSTMVGSLGDVVRVRSRNRTGLITLTLQGASIYNDYLSAIANADELGVTVDAGVGPFLIKDLNGTTLLHAADAWIRKIASYEAAMEHTNREWVFECAEIFMDIVGGALR